MPDEAEVHALLALMRLHHARRRARFVDGELVRLADQDRTLWDADQIAAGRAAPRSRPGAPRPRPLRPAGRDRVAPGRRSDRLARDRRALRAALPRHRLARGRAQPRRRGRRGRLARTRPSPSSIGLSLDGYRYLHSTRAELLRRLDRPEEAAAAYRRALELTDADAEARFLRERLASL